MKSLHNNILLIAGTGRNSGKTALACQVIESFAPAGVTAVKISPHFHNNPKGPDVVASTSSCTIYRERNKDGMKDSARMLKAGATEAYYIEVTDANLKEAFEKLLDIIPHSAPLVIESPALRKKIKPGVFLIVDHPETRNKKEDVLEMKSLANRFINTAMENPRQVLNHLHLDENGWTYLP